MPTLPSATASSLEALTQEYRAITNNLANVNTPGFKRARTSFRQLLDAMSTPADASGEAQAPGGTVYPVSAIDFSQGVLTRTGRSLDLALEGDGFFELETTEGPLYTRSGKFHVNAQRQLVDGAGRLVAGQAGPISLPPGVPPGQVGVSRDGGIRAGGSEIGRPRIVRFDQPSELVPAGDGCFRAPAGVAATEATDVSVHQGYVESSNVSAVEELIGLITVTRLYQANVKMLTAQDESLERILDVAAS